MTVLTVCCVPNIDTANLVLDRGMLVYEDLTGLLFMCTDAVARTWKLY